MQALLYLRMFKMYNREVREYNKIVQEYQQKVIFIIISFFICYVYTTLYMDIFFI